MRQSLRWAVYFLGKLRNSQTIQSRSHMTGVTEGHMSEVAGIISDSVAAEENIDGHIKIGQKIQAIVKVVLKVIEVVEVISVVAEVVEVVSVVAEVKGQWAEEEVEVGIVEAEVAGTLPEKTLKNEDYASDMSLFEI